MPCKFNNLQGIFHFKGHYLKASVAVQPLYCFESKFIAYYLASIKALILNFKRKLQFQTISFNADKRRGKSSLAENKN